MLFLNMPRMHITHMLAQYFRIILIFVIGISYTIIFIMYPPVTSNEVYFSNFDTGFLKTICQINHLTGDNILTKITDNIENFFLEQSRTS